MDVLEAEILRALCFHDVCGYPPTRIELLGDATPWSPLIVAGRIVETRGRLTFPGRMDLVSEHEAREALFPRKLRRARQVVRWLRRLGGVRFVALCNTTALAHARDASDLDFFVIARAGTIWQTRAAAALPFKMFHLRPEETSRDAVCLSFFVDETALDLSPLHLPGDDVYFCHWFLSLLPLFDDGISAHLWEANRSWLTIHHPHARIWLAHPELCLHPPRARLPTFQAFESWTRTFQQARFPEAIRASMNQDSHVVVNDHVLKFHVEDGRERFREAYHQNVQKYEVFP